MCAELPHALPFILLRNIWATFVASVTAFATVYAIEYGLEDHGTFLFSITQGDACGTFLPVEYFFFAMLGVACGLVGAAFNWMQRWLNQLRAAHMNRSRLTRIAELLAISLLTSAAAVFYPLLYPCQDATAQVLFPPPTTCLPVYPPPLTAKPGIKPPEDNGGS